jgi:hypothetical protein
MKLNNKFFGGLSMSVDQRLLSKPEKINLELENYKKHQKLLQKNEELLLPPYKKEEFDEIDIEM